LYPKKLQKKARAKASWNAAEDMGIGSATAQGIGKLRELKKQKGTSKAVKSSGKNLNWRSFGKRAKHLSLNPQAVHFQGRGKVPAP